AAASRLNSAENVRRCLLIRHLSHGEDSRLNRCPGSVDHYSGYLTFDEEPCGTYEICPVCYWEDDIAQNKDPDYDGGANGISLNNAKENFFKYGAIKRVFLKNVRKPLDDESL
ncbi:CPCC family cysteine-rich protein, partial [Pseudomonas aeruginosa]|uniref:CPCC family cysteine-rich protein n=3 Tax=Pseudomonas aeruginosa TaxID=287 RepID=UPI0039EAE702